MRISWTRGGAVNRTDIANQQIRKRCSLQRYSLQRYSLQRYSLHRYWLSAATTVVLLAAGCDSAEVVEQPSEISESVADPASAMTDSEAATPTTPEPAAPEPTAPEPTQLAKLTIGDPAPDLQVSTWVMGDAVDSSLESGVHVVEFWATWCGPCLAGMPHISELQEHHGENVTFVGVTNEDVETVENFLEEESRTEGTWRDVIKYRLATDADGATNTAYMKAARQRGIPTAFIVGSEGLIEWIGHPMRIDEPLQSVVDGNWDRDAALLEFQQMEQAQAYAGNFRNWANAGQWEVALAELDQIEHASGPIPMLLNHRLKLYSELGRPTQDSLDLIDRLEEKIGRNVQLVQARWQIVRQANMPEQAAELLGELVDLCWDNARQLNAVAWNIVTGSEDPDLDLAMRAAERASELTDNQNPSVLDTLARIHYEKGDLEAAIKWQQLASENAGGNEDVKRTLEKYLGEREDGSDSEPDESSDQDSESEPEESEPASEIESDTETTDESDADVEAESNEASPSEEDAPESP